MTPEIPLPLSGLLGNSSLIDTLRNAATLHAYCTIQVAGSPTSGEISMANGHILLEDAADPTLRKQAMEQILTVIGASFRESGAFRLVPLSNTKNADSLVRLQVEAAIQSAMARASGAPAAPPATPVLPASPTPLQTAPLGTAPAQPTVDAPRKPATATAATPQRKQQPVRRVRASQLRKVLQEGGTLSEHLPETQETAPRPDAPVSRSAALRELIGQLATDSPPAPR